MRQLTLLLLGLLSLSRGSYAAEEEPQPPEQIKAGVPFVFSSDDWGVAYGAAGVITGVGQPQTVLFGTIAGSTNNNRLGFLGLYNVMVPGWDQIQFDFNVLEGDYQRSTYFLPGNPAFSDERPGTNNSNYENSVRTSAREQHYQVHMRYTLPVGAGQDGALLATNRRNRGYDNVGYEWNPMTSGITTLELQPFYQTQRLDEYKPNEADKAAGVRFILEYDNSNSKHLPTRGSITSLTYSRDWGSNNRPDWATVEMEFSKYFDLGQSGLMDQQVLAVNAWLADTPTWNSTTSINGQEAYRRPPSFAGVTLGGWYKMRGYSTDRFYGRSAVSYSLEYRVLPNWQPMQDMPLLGPVYDIPWWQWALFVDAGRVSDDFSLKELHEDMKANVGIALRFQVEGITVRTSISQGTEDWFWRIFINQPF